MFDSIITSGLTLTNCLICFLVALVLGLLISYLHMKTSKYNKNFIMTLSVLPLLVSVVIMMVNGNLGTGIAVVGAFSLVRFRSIPGNSREIMIIFFAMAIGLALGMGYVAYAVLITLIASLFILILQKSSFGDKKKARILRITIPEELDYTSIFDDIFEKYTSGVELVKVKTTNLGSLFELDYCITLKSNEKDFIDELRSRNGNLKIILERSIDNENEL